MNPSPIAPRALWWLFAAAVASSIPALWFYLVGEEGILVNASLEMAQRGEWRRLWLFGMDAMHGVFANWLVIIVSNAVGWVHAPGVTRAIMTLCTGLSGLLAAALAWRLYRDAMLAALAAVITVTFADVLMYRGWLGYRDPLLAMLVFGAILCLWLALLSRRSGWLLGVLVCSSAGFLTKGLIAYAYVGAAALVFLWQRDARAQLLRPVPVLIAAATLSVPLLWAHGLTGDQHYNTRMGSEIGAKLALPGMGEYLTKLAVWPLETFARLLPVPLLLFWYRKRMAGPWLTDHHLRTALAILVLCALPFWIAPGSHIRYVMPVFPLLAVVLAAWVIRMDIARVTLRWLWALVAVKLVLAIAVFPAYQHQVRGENYARAARDIAARTQGTPLYTLDAASAGLSVTAYLNLMRWPQPAIRFALPPWTDGYVLSQVADPALGKTVSTHALAGDTLYLLCRGTACSTDKRSEP